MRVLLLGSRGQLGSAICQENERRSRPFDLVSCERAELDLSSPPEQIRNRLEGVRFDAVINCAALHDVDGAERAPSLAFAVNAHAVGALAAACKRTGASLVHVSTDYVFGYPTPNYPISEEVAATPLNVYGTTKYLGERLAFFENDNTLVLRLSGLFGGTPTGKRGSFVSAILRRGREGQTLRVVDDQRVSPTSTVDAAPRILDMIARRAAPGIYHLVNSGCTSWYEMAQQILLLAKIEIDVVPVTSAEYGAHARRPPYSALANDKVAGLLGPIRPWQEALDEYLRGLA